jgi:transcription elongation GreA/GreB family factor
MINPSYSANMSLSLTKSQVHRACLALIRSKLADLKTSIQDAQEAATEDTKSSAGDKYETSREMIQQEIDKATAQVATFDQMQEWLSRIEPSQKQKTIAFGSLVRCNEGCYYFSVSLGKLSVEGQTVYALSMASPLGQALAGKTAGETVSFRGRDIQIEAVQ